MILGERIKTVLEDNGYKGDKLGEVATAAKTSVSNLYKLFNKESWDSEYIIGICQLLNISSDSLLGLSGNIQQVANNRTTGSGNNVGIGNTIGESENAELKRQLEECRQNLLKTKDQVIDLLQKKSEC